jgi:3'-5' exonuclease
LKIDNTADENRRKEKSMKIAYNDEPRRPRSYVVLDVESAVIDESGHKRYQKMERWSPDQHLKPSRRNYTRSEDPLTTPRWPFQTIVTIVAMVLVEHPDGNLDVSRFVTLSQPDHDEAMIIEGALQVLADAPQGAELVSWAGMIHDVPMLTLGAMRHGLSLPAAWRWMGFGGNDPVRHLDFARTMTGGFKMKPVHMAEILASLDIPAKMSIAAFAVAENIYAGQWDTVQEACECDVISTALMLARWKRLHDPRVDINIVEDRILRQIEALREGRGYVSDLKVRRSERFQQQLTKAANDAEVLAPWLKNEAA